ncbi:hypothetical protein [Thiohalocapsa sp. ML1]|uniref:hypothetical protein n=1 Tax=Thiohalocapsa sp. ML1 TaxID=1431688 RepID=UPI0012E34149|nr:hypothetical protein [Thiohalocapsa sp. ML1]
MAQRHRIIFIIDDIDHFQEPALGALQEILDYTLTATKHRFVIACRTPFYRYILDRRWQHAGIKSHSVTIELRRMAIDEQLTRAADVTTRMRASGLNDAADRMPSLLEHPQLSVLCLQPIYFSILIWLLRNGAALDPTVANPFDLVDRAADILLRTDEQPVDRTVLYAVLGWLAANRVDGLLSPGAELQRDLGKALTYHGLGHHQQHIIAIERAICNGILIPRQFSLGGTNSLRFLHPLFRDYVLAWHYKDHPQQLVSTFTGNVQGNLDLVYFWSRLCNHASINAFARWILQGGSASPVLAATLLKALSSRETTLPPSSLVPSLSDHASAYVNEHTYDSLVAEPYIHWCAARCTAGAERNFTQLRDLCFRWFLTLEDPSLAEPQRSAVSRQANHLFGCLVRNLDETIAPMMIPLLLRFPRLRTACKTAATLIATALEAEVNSWQSSMGNRMSLALDGVPVVRATLDGLLQTLAELDTAQGFEVLCRQLWVEDRKLAAARACAPHFHPTDRVRAGFSIEPRGVNPQGTFGWLWRPFLDGEPSPELSANTTRLVLLVAQDLSKRPERTNPVNGLLWLGFAAIHHGPALHHARREAHVLNSYITQLQETRHPSQNDTSPKDRVVEQMRLWIRGRAPEFAQYTENLSSEVVLELVLRIFAMEAGPTPKHWCRSIICGKGETFVNSSEYGAIKSLYRIGHICALTGVAAAIVLCDMSLWTVVGLFVCVWFLFGMWFGYARDPVRCERESYAIDEFPLSATPPFMLGFLIVQIPLSRWEALASVLPRAIRDRSFTYLGSSHGREYFKHTTVWWLSVYCAMLFGYACVVPLDLAANLLLVLVVFAMSFDIYLQAKGLKSEETWWNPLSCLIDKDGRIQLDELRRVKYSD